MFVNTGGVIAAIIANQNAQRMRREREQHEHAERKTQRKAFSGRTKQNGKRAEAF